MDRVRANETVGPDCILDSFVVHTKKEKSSKSSVNMCVRHMEVCVYVLELCNHKWEFIGCQKHTLFHTFANHSISLSLVSLQLYSP